MTMTETEMIVIEEGHEQHKKLHKLISRVREIATEKKSLEDERYSLDAQIMVHMHELKHRKITVSGAGMASIIESERKTVSAKGLGAALFDLNVKPALAEKILDKATKVTEITSLRVSAEKVKKEVKV